MRIAKITGQLVAILLLSVSAIAAAEVKSDYDRGFDLSKLQSFRFSEQGRRNAKDVLAHDEMAAKRLHSAIQTYLVGLGMQHQPAGADFEVSYFATVRNQTEITTSGPRWGMGTVWVDQHAEGTAIVEFRDGKSGELVWRGFVTGTVDPDKSEEKISKGIRKLIERFVKDREKQKKAAAKP